MKVYAEGKNISSHSFSGLFTKGERFADTIIFLVGRTYKGVDMTKCSFMIRGVNSEGGEIQQILTPMVQGMHIALNWCVSDYFTAVAGELQLELRASKTADNGEEFIVKFTMAPVIVKDSPTGTNTVVPDTAEQALSAVSEAVSEGISQIQQTIDSFDASAIEARLDSMDANIEVFLARPEVIAVTKEQYDTIEHKANALYVIVKEVL